MTTPDFRTLLAKPVDDIKAPPPSPAGTYYGVVTAFKFHEARWEDDEGNKPLQVTFSIKSIEPGEDVLAAPELLAGLDLSKKTFSATMPISGGNEYVTKRFIEALGVATAGRGFGDIVPEAVGHPVMFDLTHRPNKNDPEAPPFTDVRNLRKRP